MQEVILKSVKYVLCAVVLILISALPMCAQVDSVVVRLKEQLRRFPQEKVALHVDRTVLLAGGCSYTRAPDRQPVRVCRTAGGTEKPLAGP